MSTIVITGGHHNSALVVAKLLIKQGFKIVWIGHRHSSRGDKSDSAEYLEVTSSDIKFIDLLAGKMVLSLREMVRFPVGVYSAFQLLTRIKPSAILSFGGYLGGTVALAAKLQNIPIYLHEQTVTAGRANKLIGRLAKHIYLTWPESAKYFQSKKIKVVGLPLREGILSSPGKTFFTRHKPTLLVMGGKLGSHRVNQFVFANLASLLTHYNIIHQTGTTTMTRDYEHAMIIKNTLGSLSDCYLPKGYIVESEIGGYLHSSDLYLGRSGAHITYELAILGLSSILVPLMSTHDLEQLKNAQILVRSGLGSILPESRLNLASFLDLAKKHQKNDSVPMNLPTRAGEELVDHLTAELK